MKMMYKDVFFLKEYLWTHLKPLLHQYLSYFGQK